MAVEKRLLLAVTSAILLTGTVIAAVHAESTMRLAFIAMAPASSHLVRAVVWGSLILGGAVWMLARRSAGRS